MQNKGRFSVLALAGYFKAERLVGEACEDLSRREGANGLFFTHSDHLGSSSWTTDADGRAVQHTEYLPFGEELLNQRATSYSEHYTFTGKELDEESNLYYYDARYNSSTYSQFTTVDPMSDKYPAVNPYLYCAGNPIKYVDPTGNYVEDKATIDAFNKRLESLNDNKRAAGNNMAIIDECNRSIDDIEKMRADPLYEYRIVESPDGKAGFSCKYETKDGITRKVFFIMVSKDDRDNQACGNLIHDLYPPSGMNKKVFYPYGKTKEVNISPSRVK